MADNVAITAGSGTTIAADDVGGILWQRVKIGIGADGSATDVSSSAPLPVTAQGVVEVAVSPTVTASAYTAGDVLGGKMTFASLLRSGVNSGVLQSITVISKAVQTTNIVVHLFKADPSNSTWTDKAAPSINSADLPNYIGAYTLANASSVLGTETIWTLDGIGKAIQASGTSLYAVATVVSTPTPASTSDFTFRLAVLQD